MKLRLFSIIFILLLCFQHHFAQANPSEVFYRVSPVFESGEARLQIRLSFKGDKKGSTVIKLPLEFGGQEQLYKSVKNLKVLNPGAKLTDTDRPEIKNISHPPGEKITLEYDLVQDWPGNPAPGGASMNAGGGYRPVIKKDYFHVLGSGTWILPSADEKAKLKVSIEWDGFPAGWQFANSFGARQVKQSFQTKAESFLSAVFVGGDYRVNQRTIKGQPVFTAIRGKWKFTDDEFAELVEKIIASQRSFWQDFKHPYYLITALPIEANDSFSAGGTGLTDSFATFMTTNLRLDDISYLLAHEYFHNWNTIAFGGMKQPEALVYWFSEGFTDYYTFQLLFRAGLIGPEKLVAQYNQFLSDYYLSEVRNVDNQRVLADFFKSYDVGKLPYRRGFLLATKWNQVISRQSNGRKSLDDVMRNILHDARRGRIKEVSKEYLLGVLAGYAKYDFAADVEKYIERGETIGDFDGVLGSCVETYEVSSGKYELGFNGSSLKTMIVADVAKTGPAFEAGLRDGQKLVGYSISFGDAAKPVELTVEENGSRKKIGYLPQSKEKVAVPQFRFRENLTKDEKDSCLRKTAVKGSEILK